ncbi:hypothetical protein GCM10009133_07160 [Cocleimonas flava]|uniref:Probable membrane transporter protein n=1 Tax=Cocleimonas flava TaxID=634765 RepID=A0A4R1F3D8_9GAMM|nr:MULTISPECIES: sulfite exporter TauE/SafE family protein [Cocleimonas]MEB8432055.1 sulfite exporter TauE/SafE family protein [Cocleimonas sp. KMM 6892]MEC4714859.1 sulfite exporter TauE/SafE family protein [Cocleimonas sp. KMM 6895]MEC4744327.1 sulfite exporter TauE/SafE family protein [Cocleimonas sp. KMM 6896]TCJ87082.1 hypothetical protein EV695_1584 [Cocleimonas flava]
MNFLDFLFIDSYGQLVLLAGVVFLAAIVRGCIGFGFSALVVASTSFWLEVKYIVVMVILMEIIASLFMLKNVKVDIDFKVLKALIITAVIGNILGVLLLANINPDYHQILISVYLLFIVAFSLSRFTFKKPVTQIRLNTTGLIAGFYDGMAAIGGIFLASMLTSSNFPIRTIRATAVVYFFIVEPTFFVSAYFNGLLHQEIFFTTAILILPMLIGITYGSKLFIILTERTLKRIVLIALCCLSIIGLIKVVLT